MIPVPNIIDSFTINQKLNVRLDGPKKCICDNRKLLGLLDIKSIKVSNRLIWAILDFDIES